MLPPPAASLARPPPRASCRPLCLQFLADAAKQSLEGLGRLPPRQVVARGYTHAQVNWLRRFKVVTK